MDSDINSSKIMAFTLLSRYGNEEFMNSLHKISSSIYNVSAILLGPVIGRNELFGKRTKPKLQGPWHGPFLTQEEVKPYFHISICFCKICNYKI